MTDPDELEEVRQKYLAMREKLQLPAARARMLADGLDPDAEIRRFETLLLQAEQAVKDALKEEENLLQAIADKEDAKYQMYLGFKTLLAETKATNPLHPKLEELEEFVEAFAELFPPDMR